MSTYSREQVAQAMRDAGFPEVVIPVGVAISTAESGRRSEALNDNPPIERSIGPWQINVLAHHDVSEECAADIACSTRAAFRISSGGSSWHAWGAFTNGSYQRFLEGADPAGSPAPVTSKTPGAPTATHKPVTNPIDGAARVLDFATTASNWYRVAFVTIGVVAIVVGMRLYMTDEPKVVESAQRDAQEVGSHG